MPDKLIDSYGREITYLRISVTDRCNLRCVYCMPEGGIELLPSTELLSYEELLRIIRIAVELGIKKFRITGGEPLVRKDILRFLDEAVKVAKAVGKDYSDDIEFTLTTNGVLFSESTAVKIFNAGIRRINISLDTLDNEKFKKISRTNVELSAVLDGIKAAIAVGFEPVKVNVVVMSSIDGDFANTVELENFIEFAIKNEVVVRFIEQIPFGVKTPTPSFSLTKFEDEMVKKYSLILVEILGTGPGRHYKFSRDAPGRSTKSSIGFIESISRPFCRICNRLRLTPDGKIRLCLGYKYELDIKHLLRNNATDSELKLLFSEAVKSKPKEHNFNEFYRLKECMAQIGG